jgi:hypothetical protein
MDPRAEILRAIAEHEAAIAALRALLAELDARRTVRS